MPVAAPIQTNFNAGEFSPLAYGRVDFPKYKNGVVTMQNMIGLIQGATTRRTGSLHVKPTKTSGASVARLIPFVFSDGDAYVLEFGDFYVRFYKNRAPNNVVGAAAYNAGTNYNIGDYVTSVGIQYISLQHPNTGHTPASSPTFWHAQDIYEIASPYAVADIENIRTMQENDVVYIVHPKYAPQKLLRAGATSWSFQAVVFSDGPYLSINSGTGTITPSATTGAGVTLTLSSASIINGGVGWLSTDVGRLVRLKHGTTWGWAIITARTNATVAVCTVQSAFGAITATVLWRLGLFSDTTGYPSVVFSFQDRVSYAASTATPLDINMSKSSDYDNFAPTATDGTIASDNALQLRLNAGRQDPVLWCVGDERGLIAGTKGGEWLIAPSVLQGNNTLSATNLPSANQSTAYGSAAIEPLKVGKATLFTQTSQRKVREMAYVYQVDGFQAPDMTVLANHITKGLVKRMAYQQEPYSLVWAILQTGGLIAMTYNRDQDVVGWHRHVLGGFSNAGATAAPLVESIACIPTPDGTADDLWMIVNRYINGSNVRHVEYLGQFNDDYDSPSDCYFVDDGIQVTLGGPGTAVSGLSHLEGQTVSLLVDGALQPPQTVSGGAITLARAGTKVAAGLPFASRIKTLRIEAGSADGTAQGKIKRIHDLYARLHQTVGLRVGPSFDKMDDTTFRSAANPMGAPIPLFSGDKQLQYEGDYDFDGYVCLEQMNPLPFTLLALMPKMNTQDAA